MGVIPVERSHNAGLGHLVRDRDSFSGSTRSLKPHLVHYFFLLFADQRHEQLGDFGRRTVALHNACRSRHYRVAREVRTAARQDQSGELQPTIVTRPKRACLGDHIFAVAPLRRLLRLLARRDVTVHRI